MSRPTRGPRDSFRIRGYHPLRPAFPDPSAHSRAATGLLRFRSPLLAESLLMSVPPGTEMFQFPGFAPSDYGFIGQYPKGVGCPIRISTDQRLLAAPRGFSQRATSFIASWCQGIHRMPLSCSKPTPATHRNQPRIGPRHHRKPHRRSALREQGLGLTHTHIFRLCTPASYATTDPMTGSLPPVRHLGYGRTLHRQHRQRSARPAPAKHGGRTAIRPETHQNLIYTCKEHHPRRPQPTAGVTGRTRSCDRADRFRDLRESSAPPRRQAAKV